MLSVCFVKDPKQESEKKNHEILSREGFNVRCWGHVFRAKILSAD